MHKLDLLDRRILYELDMNARIPASGLARVLRRSKETVNFRIRRLIQAGVVKNFYTIFDAVRLGTTYYKFYIKLRNITSEKEKEMTDYITGLESVIYFAKMEGYYDYVVLTVARKLPELINFLYPFMRLYGEYVQERQMVVFLSTHRLNQRFLYAGEKRTDRRFRQESGIYDADEKDLEIMTVLSSNARAPLADIAKRADLDPASVKYRMSRLEKKGIILGYAAGLDYDRLGLRFVQINVALADPYAKKEMIDYFGETDKCLFAIETVGRYDLVIEVFVSDNSELNIIIDGFRNRFYSKYYDFDVSSITKEHVVLWLPDVHGRRR